MNKYRVPYGFCKANSLSSIPTEFDVAEVDATYENEARCKAIDAAYKKYPNAWHVTTNVYNYCQMKIELVSSTD